MSRFQVGARGWPAHPASATIEAGTVIDTSLPEWAWVKPEQIPLDAIALDQATYDELVRCFEKRTDQFLHLLQYAKGVKPKGA